MTDEQEFRACYCGSTDIHTWTVRRLVYHACNDCGCEMTHTEWQNRPPTLEEAKREKCEEHGEKLIACGLCILDAIHDTEMGMATGDKDAVIENIKQTLAAKKPSLEEERKDINRDELKQKVHYRLKCRHESPEESDEDYWTDFIIDAIKDHYPDSLEEVLVELAGKQYQIPTERQHWVWIPSEGLQCCDAEDVEFPARSPLAAALAAKEETEGGNSGL